MSSRNQAEIILDLCLVIPYCLYTAVKNNFDRKEGSRQQAANSAFLLTPSNTSNYCKFPLLMITASEIRLWLEEEAVKEGSGSRT